MQPVTIIEKGQTGTNIFHHWMKCNRTQLISIISKTPMLHIPGTIESIISDERIGEAVQFIMPNQRAVLLLSFFKDYSDMEIARLLGISHKTVAYRKKNAMTKLKLLVEGMNHGEEEK